MIKQAAILVLLAAILGLGVNLVSPNKIAYVGSYRTLSGGNDPIVPPAAAPGDPPFIGLDVAQLEFNAGGAVFIDARETEEFDCGTIPGAVNIPFEHLPDLPLAPYFDSALSGAGKDQHLITFCSGDECDLSLHLSRNLQACGYNRLSIFFGGAREWENAGLPVERRRHCDD
ncbi:MAG TPA: rhodanese-like domain-containing protein [Candidatus Deferrimicrobium sp.]|nr:rhodanese-like domain-containing protein [Candidatus Deferrimicrobium sp.]